MPMPASGPVFSIPESIVCLLFIALVPLAAAGLALINTGLGRLRSAAHSMMASLCVFSVAVLVYFLWGQSLQGFAGEPARIAILGGKSWSWLANGSLFFRHLPLGGSPASLAALLGMITVGVVALIPLGSGADRWRLYSACLSTVLLAGIAFPIFAHWAWGGGWLAQLGAHYGLGRGFIDAGGSGAIAALGGLAALSIAWILGPRQGKYSLDGMPTAIPGHNAIFVLFGCILALLGWWGLNSAGALLYLAVPFGRVVLVIVNTTLSAAAAALTAAIITSVRFGRPDASLTSNGWIGGLVASSAGCAFVAPLGSLAIGIIAGALVALSVEWIELRLSIDDPGGSISAFGIAGIWGVLAVAIFAHIPAGSMAPGETAPIQSDQWLAQFIGIATLIGFVLPLVYGLNWLLNRFVPQRVAPEGERQGLDLYELGAGAYPETVTHGDEYTRGG
ncbi:MAG: ammonium transporter [Acidobacteriota bacterium]|nr:ammonium transporter [Acidobacteriota bacterium]